MTRACRPCGSPSTTGPSRGTAGPARHGSRGEPWTATGASCPAARGGAGASPTGSGPSPSPGRTRMLPADLAFRSSLTRPPTKPAWRRSGPDRRRRHLPGEPDAAARDVLRRRPLAAVPTAPHRRSVALLGFPRPRQRRAGRSRKCPGAPPRDPVGLARAVPHRPPRWPRLDRPDQGHPAPRPYGGRGPGAGSRAPRKRQGPCRERDDRRRAPQRPRPRLPSGHRPRAAALPARANGGGPAPRLDRDRPAGAGPRRIRPARGGFPGGTITGAPKIRAMEILAELEPIRRGPYTGALGWIGPDGAMAVDPHPDARRRRQPADAPRRRRDHLAERPGGRVGRDGRPRPPARSARSADGGRLSMASWVWLDGRIVDADGPHLRVADRGFQLGDGIFETRAPARGVAVELDEHLARLPRARPPWHPAAGRRRHARPGDRRAPRRGVAGRDRRRRSGPGRRVAPDHGLPGSARAPRAAPAGRRAPADDRRPGLAVRADAGRPPRARPPPVPSAVRRDPDSPLNGLKSTSRADFVYARLEAARAGADDALFLTIDGSCARRRRPTSSRSSADARDAVAQRAILAGTTRTGSSRTRPRSGSRRTRPRSGPTS